jgi:hypothetical protein
MPDEVEGGHGVTTLTRPDAPHRAVFRLLLVVLAAVLFAAGWAAAKSVLACRWLVDAVATGWVDAGGPRKRDH